MQKTELEKYKTILEARQAQLVRDLRDRKDIAVQKSPDLLEESQLNADREMVIRALNRESKLLRDVRAALQRIAQGTYGTCLQCEEKINPKRLNAVPWAAYCVRCQETADREDADGAVPRSPGSTDAIDKLLADVA